MYRACLKVAPALAASLGGILLRTLCALGHEVWLAGHTGARGGARCTTPSLLATSSCSTEVEEGLVTTSVLVT